MLAKIFADGSQYFIWKDFDVCHGYAIRFVSKADADADVDKGLRHGWAENVFDALRVFLVIIVELQAPIVEDDKAWYSVPVLP